MTKRDRRAAAKHPPPPDPTPLATAKTAAVIPALRVLFDPREPWLIPLLILIASRVIAFLALPVASEDAYITFRYARNLAAGNGLVYNPGEAVMGFTSLLWTLWSALGFSLTGDPVTWARGTALVGDALTLVLCAGMLRNEFSRAAAWSFACFFAAWPYFAAVAASGMENSTMLTLIVLSAALARRGHAGTGPALAALGLIRPEGIASAILIALGTRWRDRLSALLLTLIGWVSIAIYYGTLVPQSVYAKASLYGTPGPWFGRHWWEWLSPVALGRQPVTGEGSMLFPLVLLLAPALVVGLMAIARRREGALVLVAAGTLVVWCGYIALGVTYFYWYLAVPLAGVALVAAAGLPSLVGHRAVYVTLALLIVGSWPLARVLYVGRMQNELFGFGNAATYLSQAARPGESVMLEPIGMVGYKCPLLVIDEVGLVSPEVAKRRLEGPGWYADIAAARRPDWLVVRQAVRESGGGFAGAGAPFRSPAERDSLFARYQRVHVADASRGDLEVFRRAR